MWIRYYRLSIGGDTLGTPGHSGPAFQALGPGDPRPPPVTDLAALMIQLTERR